MKTTIKYNLYASGILVKECNSKEEAETAKRNVEWSESGIPQPRFTSVTIQKIICKDFMEDGRKHHICQTPSYWQQKEINNG